MAKPSDPSKPPRAAMSSIVPRKLLRAIPQLLKGWIPRFLHSGLPLKWADALNHFYVETRLIFSRSIILLVAALFIGFLWITIKNEINRQEEVYIILLVQSIILAILMNMNLWESERESHTFELLIMRIPSVNRLIWFKLRVSLGWTAILSLPFFAGYAFFVEIPLLRILAFYAYCMMAVGFVTLLTSITSSFVHHGLTAGIITIVAFYALLGFTEGLRKVPYGNYVQPFMYPFHERLAPFNLTTFQTVKLIAIDRLILIAAIAGLFTWFRRRLMKTEKWIG